MRRLLILLLLLCTPLLHSGGGGSGKASCPSSGQAALSTLSIPAAIVTIQAPVPNTGTIYTAINTVTTSTGIALTIGSSYTWGARDTTDAYNLNQIVFACTVSADSVTYAYAQ